MIYDVEEDSSMQDTKQLSEELCNKLSHRCCCLVHNTQIKSHVCDIQNTVGHPPNILAAFGILYNNGIAATRCQ